MNERQTKKFRLPFERQLASAIRTILPPGQTFVLLGTTYTSEDLIALVDGRVDALASVVVARADLTKTLDAEFAHEVSTRALFAAFRDLLHLMYGADPDVLVTMGLTPHKKRGPLTLDERGEVVDRMMATRRARHTKGKRQRAKIKGRDDAATVSAPASEAARDGSEPRL